MPGWRVRLPQHGADRLDEGEVLSFGPGWGGLLGHGDEKTQFDEPNLYSRGATLSNRTGMHAGCRGCGCG